MPPKQRQAPALDALSALPSGVLVRIMLLAMDGERTSWSPKHLYRLRAVSRRVRLGASRCGV